MPATVIAAIAGAAVFILAQDHNGRVIMVDAYPIVNAALFALGAASTMLSAQKAACEMLG